MIKPSTALAADAIRLFMANKRQFGKTGKLLQAIEFNNMIFGGNRNSDAHECQHVTNDKTLWIQNVAHQMKIRNIEIINNDTLVMTSNKTIMELAYQYKDQNKISNNIMKKINHVRLWKQILLPFELFGIKGNKETENYKDIAAKSTIEWDFKFPKVERPSRSCFKQ